MNIFEIERYATEDGPGIRTVVFLKGCNLRCLWCQNPESHLQKPQIMYYQKQCAGCERCVQACPTGSVLRTTDFGYITNHETCIACGACVDACFYGARKIIGRQSTVEQILLEVLKDKPYFLESGGGVTFSGGEPLLQAQELARLAFLLQEEGIHTALETAGHVPWETIERVLPVIDLFYYDFKHIDSDQHQHFTAVPNALILSNMQKLSRLDVPLIVRIPVIPGVNDSAAVISRMFDFLINETQVKLVELLMYHRLGLAKYQGLGMHYGMGDAQNLSKDYGQKFADIGTSKGLQVSVGAK